MDKQIYKKSFVKIVLNGMGFLFVFFMIMSMGISEAEVVDRIVAVVNSDIILLSDLNRELKPVVENIKAQGFPSDKEGEEISRYRNIVLGQLINEVLIDQEIKRYGISVTDEEVNESLTRVREGKNLTIEQFENEVKNDLGLSMAEYKEKIKEQLLRMKLINSEVQSKVVITDEDRKQYHEQFEEEQTGGTRYHLRNIIMTVSKEATDEERKEIMDKMKSALEELKNGASFASVADKYSETSRSGEGGDLGFFRFVDLSSELQEVLKETKEGEYTPIIETDMGYQILYVEKIEENADSSMEGGPSPDIDQRIYNANVNKRFQEWLNELRERSLIKIVE